MKQTGFIIGLLLLCLVFAIGAKSGLITLLAPTSQSQNTSTQTLPTAQAYIDQGKLYLQAHNILAARDQFNLAVQTDSTNQEANLLYGVTRVFAVMEDETANASGLDSVREILELAGASIQSFSLYGSNMNMPKKLASTTPRTGAVLDFLKDKAMPEIDGAIANLATVTNTSFTSVIAPADLGKTTGNDITVDYPDVLIIKALLNAAKCNMNLLMVYGLDVSLPDIQANPEQLMTYKQLFQDASFLAVKDASSLTSAQTALNAFIDAYTAAIPLLKSRAGSGHHLFVVDVPVTTNEPVSTSSTRLDKIQNMLNEVKQSLNGPHTFTGNAPENMRTIDLSKFFDAAHPINIRAMLADANTKTIIPDPSIGGLFPEEITGYETFAAKYGPDVLGVIFTGQETPFISVTPKSLALSYYSPAYITIRNTGTAGLHVSSINLSGTDASDFTLNTGTCGAAPTLAPETSCSASVTLKIGATAGNKSATLQIASNDVSSPVTSVDIVGSSYGFPAVSSFTGNITNSNGAAISGATVEVIGYPTFTATSDSSGNFTLTGLPTEIFFTSGSGITLKVSKTGFAPVYGMTITSTSSSTAFLYTPEELAALGVQPGKGAIDARVFDMGVGGYVSDAVVTATSARHPATPYPVTYFDDTGPGGSSTSANGRIMVLNVDDGDTVALSVSNMWSQALTVPVHAGAVSEAPLFVTSNIVAGNGAISVSPASWEFGSVPVGGISATQSFTITNTGAGNLTIRSANGIGDVSQFFFPPDVTNPCPTITQYAPFFILTPGESCNLATAFIPRTAGAKTVFYAISSDADNTSALNIPLSGHSEAKTQDFDGDGKSDIAVWRSGTWFIMNSLSGTPSVAAYGTTGDIPVAGDYDGDGRTDLAVWRGGTWFIMNSADNSQRVVSYGTSSDIPVPGDYDGDSKTDIAVFRPSDGNWFIMNSATNTQTVVNYGTSGDIPVPGDYDGDGKTDITVWRNGTWFIMDSATNTQTVVNYGTTGDIPVPGDYDGIGRTEIAVFRPSDGKWYIMNTKDNSQRVVTYGTSGDIPVPGDFDGDGKTDIAVWRPASGTWFIINSSTGTQSVVPWGVSSDVPIRIGQPIN